MTKTPSSSCGADIDALEVFVRHELTNWATWRGGWRDDADAALIDAVFSTRAKYETTVLPLVRRWMSWPDRPAGRGLSAVLKVDRQILLGDSQRVGILNKQYTPGRSTSRLLKVDALIDVANRLVNCHSLDTPDQLRAAASTDPNGLRRIIQETKGVGRAQSSYFLMLLGVQGIKADTMVMDFVRRGTRRTSFSQQQVEHLLTAAADKMGVEPIALDHAIWRHESTKRSARRPKRQSTP